jgi:hypothetical protein
VARLGQALLRKLDVADAPSLAPLLLHEMAQLPLHRLERVVDNFGQRGVGAIVHLLFVRDELVTRWNRHIDPHPELVPFLMGMIGLLDGHVASIDVIAESFEPSRFLQNELVELVGFLDAAIGNVYGLLHDNGDATLTVG